MVTEIAPYPQIKVKAELEGGFLQRITLSPAKSFCLEGDHPALLQWLKDYSQGKEGLFIAIPLPYSFTAKVLNFMLTIPRGTVLTYKEIAEKVGHPRAARAVGNICRGNLFPLVIPCHRVIRSDGTMGHYTPDPYLKLELLRFEDVTL